MFNAPMRAKLRAVRGVALAERVIPVGGSRFRVPSSDGRTYKVGLHEGRKTDYPWCECADFIKGDGRHTCKHLYAVLFFLDPNGLTWPNWSLR